MKVLNSFAMMIACSVSFNICYAKENSEWNDYLQDSTQINSPIEYIDSYNKYTVINPNLKIKLVDFGNMANSNMRCDSFKSLMIINKLSKLL